MVQSVKFIREKSFFLLRYGRLIKVGCAGWMAVAALAGCLPLWDALISMGSKQPRPKSLVDL